MDPVSLQKTLYRYDLQRIERDLSVLPDRPIDPPWKKFSGQLKFLNRQMNLWFGGVKLHLQRVFCLGNSTKLSRLYSQNIDKDWYLMVDTVIDYNRIMLLNI